MAAENYILKEYVGVASTGVIGEMMPMNILENGFQNWLSTVMLMISQNQY